MRMSFNMFDRVLLLGPLLGLIVVPTLVAAQTTAFYYGRHVPRELAAAYDQLVVQPDSVPNPAVLAAEGTTPVAYLSVGEVAENSRFRKDVSDSWILAKNNNWSSLVMDVRNSGWQAYLLDRQMQALWSQGYRAFFLDTLDSYQLGVTSPEDRAKMQQALAQLVRQMVARYPQVRLLINRGFELLPQIGSMVHGVVAESLFDRWDAASGQYMRVPEADRNWLLARLQEAHKRYNLPITVIDYRPPNERQAARLTASRIAGLGFIPWVSDATLSTIGIGSIEVVPRRILILTNEPDSVKQETTDAFRFLAPVLEYLGYIPEIQRIQEGLPRGPVAGVYQGVITWFSSPAVPADYESWLQEQIGAGVKVVFFGYPGFALDGNQARKLGIEVSAQEMQGDLHVDTRDQLIGFEAQPQIQRLEAAPLHIGGDGVAVHLQLADAAGHRGAVIATTRWGGLAHSHFLAMSSLDGERAWVLDPFAFLQQALDLPSIPQPDVTTENGRRLAMFLMDAEGLGQPARYRGRPITGELLKEQLLSRYRLPLSLDVPSQPEHDLSIEDRAAATRLLQVPMVRPGHLQSGGTDIRSYRTSITHVQSMAAPNGTGDVYAPTANDLTYLDQATELYPYHQVVQTLELTDNPRRLKPIAIHYHAFAAGSYGGINTLETIYGWVLAQDIFPVYVDEYQAKVRAFRQQVVVRHLDGSFGFHGGDALRTVRVPTELGLPDLAASRGVVAVRTLPQGCYVSFAADHGPRQLVLGQKRLERPHVVQVNATVLTFKPAAPASGGSQIQLRIAGHVPLVFELGGLTARTHCRLTTSAGSIVGDADRNGLLKLTLTTNDTGEGILLCADQKEGS